MDRLRRKTYIIHAPPLLDHKHGRVVNISNDVTRQIIPESDFLNDCKKVRSEITSTINFRNAKDFFIMNSNTNIEYFVEMNKEAVAVIPLVRIWFRGLLLNFQAWPFSS